jgi:NAD(P)-binding Rossmann-like domain
VDTDYLVVGAGASGLAFVDTLVAETDAEVTVIDRGDAPGGHWLHAYPFVRLHTPSAYHGVNSLTLGEDRIDLAGENTGFYERATGEEVCAYFTEAAALLTQTGRVRVLTGHEHLGAGSNGEQVRDLRTGELDDVAVRRKVVDARYLEASIPATHVVPFDVAPGVRVMPVNDLPEYARSVSACAVSGQVRQPRTRACGFWTTAWTQTGFAGSGRGMRGSMTVGTFSRWGRLARSWRGSPSMPRLALRRRTSTTSSSGSRLRGGSCASTRRRRRRCSVARCSARTS